MAVKIRLAKFGKKGQPTYRLVAVDERKKRSGAYIENLGFYNPSVKPAQIKIKKERVEYWKSRGAQMSEAVKKLVEQK